ncbi:MAG: PQQ-dependent dehydrogenase, methanol/ethanol family [Alphaproteobacteria bacterium]|nr:PQQ-dependent dehydrogenase, methanol/ethanol family [Alphaproteobacteria bacterium]
MRGFSGPLIGFGSFVLAAAAGFYFFAPNAGFFTRGPTGNQAVAEAAPAGAGTPAPAAPGAYPAGTPRAAAAESATRKGTTTGAPTPEEQAALAKAAAVTEDRINNAESEPQNWLTYGRTRDEQRYSTLDQINKSNVAQLGVAWELETGTVRGLEASPIVVDGIMFFSLNWGVVKAVEAKTGKLLWTYDPDVPGEWARNACCDIVNRGVAVYEGRVYVGSLDGRLVALDAKTGKPDWIVNTLIDRERPYTITGAPRVAKGAILIGNGGAELGARGYVTAFDAKTGAVKWRFFTVPRDPSTGPQESKALEMALETWSKDPKAAWLTEGGGGTTWDSIVYDPELNLVYLGVGNGSPWNADMRSPGGGDNLFLSSIVAVNADTGEYVWHYQTTPSESWDYTATQPIMVANLMINGEKRRVVMQAPKNGFFYVLDAKTGKFISAQAYSGVNWASGIDADGRPIKNPDVYYLKEPKNIRPGPQGAHNWMPMAFNPTTGLVYIPVIDAPSFYKKQEPYAYTPGLWNTGTDFAGLVKFLADAAASGQTADPQLGFIRAWDPLTQKERWSVPMPGPWNGGMLTTAGGLVFNGGANGIFAAYDAASGEQVWKIDLTTGILAPPVTFQVDGEQYIALLAGWGGAWGLANAKDPTSAVAKYNTNQGRLFVFKLGGKQQVAALPPTRLPMVKPPAGGTDQALVDQGFVKFHQVCTVCHGFFAESVGVLPDLRMSQPEIFDQYNDIVLGGALAPNGMASFADVLKPEDVEAIRQYILSEANKLWTKTHPGDGSGHTPTE